MTPSERFQLLRKKRHFVCKHQSHEKYPIKKHLLITLKLTFHTNQQTANSNHDVNISNEEKAIYIVQTIKVGQQQNLLFYDMDCCDMVSRYNAIKTFGDRAVQELPQPISIDGVGNVEIKMLVCQITVQFQKHPLQGRVEKHNRKGYK